jgi:hypothetical protein
LMWVCAVVKIPSLIDEVCMCEHCWGICDYLLVALLLQVISARTVEQSNKIRVDLAYLVRKGDLNGLARGKG